MYIYVYMYIYIYIKIFAEQVRTKRWKKKKEACSPFYLRDV